MISDATSARWYMHLLYWGIPVVVLLAGYYILRYLYAPRNAMECRALLVDKEARRKLRERKRRLDAIRNRAPGSILPGIPTSQRDFALEPLIRNRKFKEARAYIMEQLRRQRNAPDGSTSRTNIYVQYLDLIEGSV
jgi:hypothetical protein